MPGRASGRRALASPSLFVCSVSKAVRLGMWALSNRRNCLSFVDAVEQAGGGNKFCWLEKSGWAGLEPETDLH